jgi:hypothetical protein
MRDLEAIGLNVGACLLRARISAQRPLERQLRRVVKGLASFPVSVTRRLNLVEIVVAAAETANAAGDAALAADLFRAARDLRAWYHFDDVT